MADDWPPFPLRRRRLRLVLSDAEVAPDVAASGSGQSFSLEAVEAAWECSLDSEDLTTSGLTDGPEALGSEGAVGSWLSVDLATFLGLGVEILRTRGAFSDLELSEFSGVGAVSSLMMGSERSPPC